MTQNAGRAIIQSSESATWFTIKHDPRVSYSSACGVKEEVHKNPVENGRFRLIESDCIRNGLSITGLPSNIAAAQAAIISAIDIRWYPFTACPTPATLNYSLHLVPGSAGIPGGV